MKIENAIKRLEKAAGHIIIDKRNDGTPWKARASFGDWEVSFLANGRWTPDGLANGFHVRKHNDQDDIYTDYFAGSFRSNLKQAIESAKRLDADTQSRVACEVK